MRIERGATNGLLMAARPTLSPSYWLLRFVKAEDETVYQLCIADAVKVSIGNPVMVEFAEVASGADPQSAEVTLSPGQWLLYAYEQSTTSLNWTLASRLAYEQLVEVVGAAAPDPDPTDPCGDSDPCEVIAAAEASEVVSCTPDANKPALYGALTADDAITPEVIVTALDGADKTDEVKAIICDECPPCEDGEFRTTDGATKIADVPSGGSADAQQSIVYYEDHLGSVQGSDPSDTEFDGTYIHPALVVPAREILNENLDPVASRKVTLYDLIFDTLPLVQAPCLLTVNVTVDGVPQTPITDVDPCVENNLTVNITYS